MLGDELVGRTPGKSQTLRHLAIIDSSGLADKHVCRFPHCQRAAGRVSDTHTRVSVNELLESRLAWKNETCVNSDFFSQDIKGKAGVWKGFVSKLPNGILVLSKREIDKDCTSLQFIIQLVPGLRRWLCRQRVVLCFFLGTHSPRREGGSGTASCKTQRLLTLRTLARATQNLPLWSRQRTLMPIVGRQCLREGRQESCQSQWTALAAPASNGWCWKRQRRDQGFVLQTGLHAGNDAGEMGALLILMRGHLTHESQ